MSENPKIFLSHSHRDRHVATELQAVLETYGAETFLDQDQIQAGDILPERIQVGISWSEIFLLIWSASAAASNWVAKEWDSAYDLRKKIIPYSLDNTPLPATLQNFVRVEADDRQHGDANLLKAIFGREMKIDPTTLFPGHWHASVDVFGMVQGSYDLELRANGQVEGTGAIEQSGVAGEIADLLGMGGILSTRIPAHGSWSYDQRSQILTLNVTATGIGPKNTEILRIRTTGRERGAIQGQDLAGREWTFQRVN